MVEKIAQNARYNWQFSLYAAVGALIVFVPLVASSLDMGLGVILYLFVITPAVTLTLFIFVCYNKGSKSLSILLMLVVYLIVSWTLVKHSYEVRSEVRWVLRSQKYKAQVLGQPLPADDELKHIEWDGWGGFGAGDTNVYLVFDPDGALASELRGRSSGKFRGISCEASDISRLESHWYAVVLYTNFGWSDCDPISHELK